MITVEYHADLKEVQSDRQLSTLLSDEAAEAPFDRIAWWRGLAEHCDLVPLLAVAREGDAVAVLPLAGTAGHLTALANWYSFRVRPIVSRPHRTGDLLGAIASDIAGCAHRITLSGVPDEDGSLSALQNAFRAAGWFVTTEPCDTNHVLGVQGRSFAEYLAARPGQLRTTLKRKTKKLQTEVLAHFDADVWREYEEIYAESWKPEEGSPDFLRAFAMEEGAAGRLRLGVARADSRAVAAQMWTIEHDTAFIHKLAHREAAKPLSPGSVLSAALFRRVIDDDKVAAVDFGTGDDGYKRDWMEQVRTRYRLDMMRPLAPRNWLVFARSGLRRLAGRGKAG